MTVLRAERTKDQCLEPESTIPLTNSLGDGNVDGLDGDLVAERSALDLGQGGVFGVELLEKVVPEPVEGPLVVVVGRGRHVSGLDGVFSGDDRGDGDVLGDGLLGVLDFGDLDSGRSFDDGRVGNGLVFCGATSRVSLKETRQSWIGRSRY